MIDAATLLHAWNWCAAEIKVGSFLLCLGLFTGGC